MKGIDIFCASQASTSTSTTHTINMHLQHPSSSSSGGGGPAIDRHNPIIRDQRRLPPAPPPPPPMAHKNKNKNSKQSHSKNPKPAPSRTDIPYADENEATTTKNTSRVLGWSCARPGDFISPATSSRYLLSEFDNLLPPQKPCNTQKKKDGDHNVFKLPSPPPPPSPSNSHHHQVVVLRVSLHCRGCERKMRKHISKMEGVSSFEIDFMAKKVTVVGDVTPLSVLNSVSKVKNAKLLTPTTIASSPDFSNIKKQMGIIV